MKILSRRFVRHEKSNVREPIDLNYEPVEALQVLLRTSKKLGKHDLIGGVAQMVKVYSNGNTLPFVTKTAKNEFFLYGRKLLSWEKSELPILDLTKPAAKS